jgi:hypothetical protein
VRRGRRHPHLFLDRAIIFQNPLNPHKLMEFVLEIKLLNSFVIAQALLLRLIL